jgi:hypothetical protein
MATLDKGTEVPQPIPEAMSAATAPALREAQHPLALPELFLITQRLSRLARF